METVNYEDLGERIRNLRRGAKMTQSDLAVACGISASFMGHIERGTRVASIETLVNICNTLNASPQYLLSASLTSFESHMPDGLSAGHREKLSEFFRLAQDALENWD